MNAILFVVLAGCSGGSPNATTTASDSAASPSTPTGGAATADSSVRTHSGPSGDTGLVAGYDPDGIHGRLWVKLHEPSDSVTVSVSLYDDAASAEDPREAVPVDTGTEEPCEWRTGHPIWDATLVDGGVVTFDWGKKHIELAFGPDLYSRQAPPSYPRWYDSGPGPDGFDGYLGHDILVDVAGSPNFAAFRMAPMLRTASQRIAIHKPTGDYLLAEDLEVTWTPGAGTDGVLYLQLVHGDTGADMRCTVFDDGHWVPPQAFLDTLEGPFDPVGVGLRTHEEWVEELPDGRRILVDFDHSSAATAYVVPKLP